MANYWTFFQGEVGATYRAQLIDGSGPVDLSVFDSVSVTIRKNLNTPAYVTDDACVIDADQTAETFDTDGNSTGGTGWLTYTLDSTSGNLPLNKIAGHLGSFKCMDGATPHYFPKKRDESRTYFRVFVQEPLS